MTPLQNDIPVSLAALGASILCGLLIHALGHLLALRAALRIAGPESFPALALARLRGPGKLTTSLLLMQTVRAAWPLPEALRVLADKAFSLAWIVALGWLAVAFIGVLSLWTQRSCDIGSTDNLQARRMLTKVRLFQRLLNGMVALLSLAAALMVFETTRNIGASLLASAGIAGAVAGFSAQRLLGAVIAGIQIAVTQPIRLDDVVVVEGEWGRVEEIGLTYVVVRIWDERRLILPSSHFIERPVQNWTRSSADILGSVFLCVDYAADVAAIREELRRVCNEAAGSEREGLWDGRVCALQVTEAGPEVMTLRALVSSADSARNWDLRCQVRERLVDFVRRTMPGALPLRRVALNRVGTAGEVGHAPARN